jgi:hypothetical protein
MNDEKFWKLISLIDVQSLDQEDDEEAVEPLIQELSEKQENEIEQFDELLAQHLFKLDGKVWCGESGESKDSSDGFLYARCYVVAKGKEFYDSVLSDPKLMPKTCSEWAESLLYVAAQSWAEATGNDEEDFEFLPSLSYETGSNSGQW